MFEYEEPRRRRYTVYGKENKAGNGYFKIMYTLCPPLLIRINLKQETQTARFPPKFSSSVRRKHMGRKWEKEIFGYLNLSSPDLMGNGGMVGGVRTEGGRGDRNSLLSRVRYLDEDSFPGVWTYKKMPTPTLTSNRFPRKFSVLPCPEDVEGWKC